jgi:mono/diheme cytochrome c family protein
MRIFIGAVLIAVVVLSSVLLLAADVAKGKEVFMTKCAACHDQSGNGKEAIGKMFKVTMKPLGSKEVQDRKDDELKNIILKGEGKMKPVAISQQQATDVVSFLRTLAKK